MIDINSLTLGEVAKVEQLSGQGIGLIADEAQPKGLAMAALAFVWHRRSEPAFTWNDAQALTLDRAKEILQIEDEDETDPAAGTDEAAADPFAYPSASDEN